MVPKRRTWRPLIIILALCVIALAVIWIWPEVQRQQRYLRSAGTFVVCAFISGIWFLFFAPVVLWRRIAFLFIGIAVIVIAASSFRITGVTGDLIPILEPKWKNARGTAEPMPAVPNSKTNSSPQPSASFPQLYGASRNAIVSAPRLDTNWTARPPRLLWQQPIGGGWSGFAVKNNLAITQEQHDEEELITCYDLLTGRRIWSHANQTRYATTIAGEGPRATPTISSNRVYTFGATGILDCLDLASGQRIWSRSAAAENDASLPEWGFSSSPLMVDDKVIVSVGGSENRSLVAYRAGDGEFLWGAGHRGAGYSSPIEATLLGERQILYFSTDATISVDLSGKPLWEHPWQRGQPKVSLPVIVSSNLVFVSSGYGAGCELIELSQDSSRKWKTDSAWKTLALKSKFAPIFLLGDYIYGLDDGIFTCVDLKTGQRRWKDGRYGHGQGLLVSGIILLTSESGEVILIKPNPQELAELGRFQVFTEKTWNPPALAGEYLLLRNHKSAACVQLPIISSLTKM